ncbi:MAG: glycosyltransferase family 2 protein [Deltaproteobacteria bacterium]|nr:glycosyltransferase family 2 protein [Deltaproteobacteria bacterium]
MYLSIIIPIYYGSKTISRLVDSINSHIEKELDGKLYEIILVNDGSKDDTDLVCSNLAVTFPKTIKYFDLAKNFSEHNAVIAGLNNCQGMYAAIIDDDFQNPPSEIIKLLKKIQDSNADVVFAKYSQKKHHWFRNLGSKFNDYVGNIMLNKPKELYLCSFKIIRQNLIKEIIKYKGPFPYIDGLILRSTHHIETQLVIHDYRETGKSNYTLTKLISLWSNMFINFSIKPLRWSLVTGFIFSLSGFLLAIKFIIEKIIYPDIPIGWASAIVSTLIFSGVQLIVLGVVGEYIGRSYLGHTNTPQYVLRKVIANGKIIE